MVIESFSEIAGILNAHPEPAALLSLDYEILAANESYTQLYGGDQRILSRKCFEVSHGYAVPCDQAGESCPLKRCSETGKKQRVLHLHNTCHGEEHVDVEMTPIKNETGEVIYFLEKMHLVKEAAASPSGLGMVGRSRAFSTMLEMIQRAAPSEISVLLLGESGTGKELVAQAIHQASRRSKGSFVTVECSGLTESLFESELFGHEKGSFTGAISRKQGLVAAARGGTLFLDEVGDIPLSLQVKLLRLIESGTYRTVGGIEPQHADFRLVCATHKSLKTMVAEGRFRQDLYYRISAFPIDLPRLAERKEDLKLLANTLLKRIPGGEAVAISSKALRALGLYAFPGNVRELRNILERAVLFADGGVIEPEHLPSEVFESPSEVDSVPCQTILPLTQVEDDYLRWVLSHYQGENRDLAIQLGVSERTLYRKIKALNTKNKDLLLK